MATSNNMACVLDCHDVQGSVETLGALMTLESHLDKELDELERLYQLNEMKYMWLLELARLDLCGPFKRRMEELDYLIRIYTTMLDEAAIEKHSHANVITAMRQHRLQHQQLQEQQQLQQQHQQQRPEPEQSPLPVSDREDNDLVLREPREPRFDSQENQTLPSAHLPQTNRPIRSAQHSRCSRPIKLLSVLRNPTDERIIGRRRRIGCLHKMSANQLNRNRLNSHRQKRFTRTARSLPSRDNHPLKIKLGRMRVSRSKGSKSSLLIRKIKEHGTRTTRKDVILKVCVNQGQGRSVTPGENPSHTGGLPVRDVYDLHGSSDRRGVVDPQTQDHVPLLNVNAMAHEQNSNNAHPGDVSVVASTSQEVNDAINEDDIQFQGSNSSMNSVVMPAVDAIGEQNSDSSQADIDLSNNSFLHAYHGPSFPISNPFTSPIESDFIDLMRSGLRD